MRAVDLLPIWLVVVLAFVDSVSAAASSIVIGGNSDTSTNTKCTNASLGLTSTTAFSTLTISVGISINHNTFVIADVSLGQCFGCSGLASAGAVSYGYNANWATGNWFLWTVTFPTANSFQLCAARFLQATNTWAEADISAQYEVATTTCAAGQYINSNFLCTACPVGKYSSSSGLTACSTCGSNQIVNLASSACIASCPAGQFNTNGTCTSCGSNCNSCSSSSICLSCSSGYTLTYPNTCTLIRTVSAATSTFTFGANSVSNAVICQTASISTAQDMALDSVALRTNSGTTTFSASSGYCFGCSQASVPPVYGAGYPVTFAAENYTWQLSYPSSASIRMCVSRLTAAGTWTDTALKLTYTITYTKCASGQYINSNFVCVGCPAGYFGSAVPLVSPMCSGPCASGTYSTLGSTACSSQCPLGQYKSGGSCLSCSGSQVVSVDSTSCVSSCPAGQYSKSGTCTYCIDNCAACTSDGCTQCKTSFATYGLSSPNVCTLAGSDQTTSATVVLGSSVEAVIPSSTIVMTLSSIRALKSVSLIVATGTTTYNASSGNCGAPSCTNFKMPSIISAGTAGSSDTQIWNLSFVSTTSFRVTVSHSSTSGANTWTDNALAFGYSYVTTPCQLGQYINSYYLCTSCPAGYYGNFVPVSTSSCSGQCLSGFYCPAGTSTPQNCAAGSYCSSPVVQVSCSTGSYCPANSTTQTACAAGSYCTTPAVQVACSSGSYCPANSTAQTACSAGNYCSTPSTQVVCSSGYYCPTSTLSPVLCAAGSYCATPSTQVACASGSYCAVGSTVSSQCTAGSYCVNASVQLSCSAGTYCPAGSTNELTCTSGSYCGAGSSAAIPCTAGSFCATPATLVACSSGSYCPSSSTVQTTCPAGSYCSNFSSQVTCSLGSYCPSGSTSQAACTVSYFCASGASRVACSSGSYCPAGTTAESLCAAGYYCPTPANQIACDPSANCTAGSTAQTFTGGNILCNPGLYYDSNGNCSVCDSGTYCPVNSTVPRPCAAGSYCVTSSSQVACTNGSYCPANSTTQSTCAAGNVCPDPSSQLTCVSGSYCPAGSTVASWCAAGSYCATAATQVVCVSGSYCPVNSTSSSSCSSGSYCSTPASQTACSAGTYCPTNSTAQTGCTAGSFCATPATQVSCSSGSYCPANSTAESLCLAGFYCPNTLLQSACASGSYCPTGSTVSTLCAAGNYCATPGTRVECSSGSYCPANSTAQSKCIAGSVCATTTVQLSCSSGSYCPASSTVESSCPAGNYCATPASQSACSSGSYCPANSTTQSTCTAGYYCSTPTTQQACGVSSNCPAGSTAEITVVAPIVCNASTFANSSNSCAQCELGSYCPTNSTAPKPCLSGHFCATPASQVECSSGSYCPANSTADNQCTAGFYCPNTTAQLPCPVGATCPSKGMKAFGICAAGYYCPHTQLTGAIACPASYFCNSSGLSAAVGLCDAGYYCSGGAINAKGGTSAFVVASPCETAGSYCPVGSSDAKGKCSSGYYCPFAATQFICPIGMYCPITSLSSSVACPIGSFCPSTGLTVAQSCSAAHYCNSTGLSGVSGLCAAGYCCTGGAVNAQGANSTAETALPNSCAAGSYCPAGSSMASPCPAGSYCPTSAQIVTCLVGSYCNAGSTAPTACPTIPVVPTSPAYQSATRTSNLQLTVTSVFTVNGNPCFANGSQPVNVSFSWQQVTSLSDATFVMVGDVKVLSSSLATDQLSISFASLSTLFIPSFTLKVNRVYLFAVAMSSQISNSSLTFSSSAYFAVSVSPSVLVPRISGGNRTVSTSSAATLDASASFDPDVSSGESSTLVFTWSCVRPVSLRSCGTLPASSGYTLQLPVGFFSAVDTSEAYSFSVIVSSDTRNATSSSVFITAVAVSLPTLSVNVSVPSQGAAWRRITPSDTVALTASVKWDSAASASAVSLQWSCVSGGPINMTAGSSALLSSPTSSTLVVAPNVLKAGAVYVFQLAAVTAASATPAVATVSVSVNSIPYNGSCTVSPLQGVAIQTSFTFTCSGWLDDAGNLPLTYGVQQVDSSGSLLNIVQAQQSNAQFSMYLPPGEPLLLRVLVQDIWGGQVAIPLSVSVTVPSVSTPAALQSVAASALSSLLQASTAGDMNAAIQVALPLSQILESSSNASSSPEGLQQRAQIRDQIFTTVLSLATSVSTRSNSASDTTQVLNLISSVVSVPAELSVSVATQASLFVANALASALNRSTVPFSSRMVTDSLSIAASVTRATSSQTNASTSATAAVAAQVSSAIKTCGLGMLIGAPAGQYPIVIQTATIGIVAARQSSSSLSSQSTSFSSSASGSNSSSASASASLPASMLADAGLSQVSNVDCLFSTNTQNPFAFASNGSVSTSPLVSMSVFDSVRGGELHIQNLRTPVMITIPHNVLSENESISCRYWDVAAQTWSTSGCVVASIGLRSSVCACTHLTDFNAFLSPPIRQISLQDIRNFFNWPNILAHPVTLIFCASIIVLWVVVAVLISHSERLGSCLCCPLEDDLQFDDEKVHVYVRQSCCTFLCDRSRYRFHMSNVSMRSVFVENILRESQNEYALDQYRRQAGYFDFLTDKRLQNAVGQNFWGMFLQQHPVFGIWYHDPHDLLTSLQRLAVLVANSFTSLAVGAMFYGASSTLLNVALIGVYTALICAPVSTYFPWAFSRAASQLQDEIDEESMFSKLKLVRHTAGRAITRCSFLLVINYVMLCLWILAAIFVCLIYGMQFDMNTSATQLLPTSSLWLFATVETLIINIFLFLPGIIAFRICFGAFFAYQDVLKNQERLTKIQTLALVEVTDLDLEHIDTDVYVAWLHRALVWVPDFGKNIEFQEKRLTVKSVVDNQSGFVRAKRVAKQVALVMLQSLVVGVLGGGAFVPVDTAAPSLDDELQFKAVSRVSLEEMRRRGHPIRFTVDDPEIENAVGFATGFDWLRREPHLVPHSSEAARALSELRCAWNEAICEVQLTMSLLVDYNRVIESRDRFDQLLSQDLAVALRISTSRVKIDEFIFPGKSTLRSENIDVETDVGITFVSVRIEPLEVNVDAFESAIELLDAVDEMSEYQFDGESESQLTEQADEQTSASGVESNTSDIVSAESIVDDVDSENSTHSNDVQSTQSDTSGHFRLKVEDSDVDDRSEFSASESESPTRQNVSTSSGTVTRSVTSFSEDARQTSESASEISDDVDLNSQSESDLSLTENPLYDAFESPASGSSTAQSDHESSSADHSDDNRSTSEHSLSLPTQAPVERTAVEILAKLRSMSNRTRGRLQNGGVSVLLESVHAVVHSNPGSEFGI